MPPDIPTGVSGVFVFPQKYQSYKEAQTMRPQRSKQPKITRRNNRYYLNDCRHCVNFRGKKRGCVLSECDFEEMRNTVKRKRGDEPY